MNLFFVVGIIVNYEEMKKKKLFDKFILIILIINGGSVNGDRVVNFIMGLMILLLIYYLWKFVWYM